MNDPPALKPGDVFAGDFEVERPLARGGMGAVYVVRQRSTGRVRALKTMLPGAFDDESLRARFEREATLSSRIESDHVVEVIAAGVDQGTGLPWMLMELLSGDDLGATLKRRGTLPPDEAAEVFRQLGHALAAAHRAGVVHRDLKPENIFLAEPRVAGAPFTVKVLDFGIAKVLQESLTSGTSTEAIGSPLWMAPEQTDSGTRIGPPADVFALGLLAFRALTGKVFWRAAHTPGATYGAVLRELVLSPIPTASERAAELRVTAPLPRGFDAWFARCVQREASARFADAAQAVPPLVQLLDARAAVANAPTIEQPMVLPHELAERAPPRYPDTVAMQAAPPHLASDLSAAQGYVRQPGTPPGAPGGGAGAWLALPLALLGALALSLLWWVLGAHEL